MQINKNKQNQIPGRQLIEDIVEEHIKNISSYVSNKIRKSDNLSPVSKKRIHLKLMHTNSVCQEIMKSFEDEIKEIEKLDEEYFRIPANLVLNPPSKYTNEECEETEKRVKELELRYKQNQAFIHMLAGEFEKMEQLQGKLGKEKETFANIDNLMTSLDISRIDSLYNQVIKNI